MSMNRMNAIVRDGLTSALSALFELSDAGCTVTAITVRGGKPVLSLDSAPTTLHGAPQQRYRVGEQSDAVMATVIDGCQVEWRAAPPPRRTVDPDNDAPVIGERYRDTVAGMYRRAHEED